MDRLSDDGDASTSRRPSPARRSSCFGLPVRMESINILSPAPSDAFSLLLQPQLLSHFEVEITHHVLLRPQVSACISCSSWYCQCSYSLRLHNRRKCIQSPPLRPYVRGTSSCSFLLPIPITNSLPRTSTTLATAAFTANSSKTTASKALPQPSPLTWQ